VVAHTIEQCLPKVGLKGTLVTRLEILNPPRDMRKRVLNEVVCVERIAGPAGQTTVRPSLEPGQVESAQIVECALIAGAGEFYERERGIGVTARLCLLIRSGAISRHFIIQRSPSLRMRRDAGLYLTGTAIAFV
jgi:hypothetical protein